MDYPDRCEIPYVDNYIYLDTTRIDYKERIHDYFKKSWDVEFMRWNIPVDYHNQLEETEEQLLRKFNQLHNQLVC